MGPGFCPAGRTVSPQKRKVEGAICENEGMEMDTNEDLMRANPNVIEDKEVRDFKKVKAPTAPTMKEWEEHMILHFPFRSWCPHCVKGRALCGPHHRADKDGIAAEEMTTVSIDYMWMKTQAERERGGEYNNSAYTGDM